MQEDRFCKDCGADILGNEPHGEQCYAARLEAAREAGADHGRAAASWYFDGNTDQETFARVLRGIEDGDPAILDTFPSGPLSGEWAGEPSPGSVLGELEVDPEDPAADDYLRAYEDGFYEASARAIEEAAWAQVSA